MGYEYFKFQQADVDSEKHISFLKLWPTLSLPGMAMSSIEFEPKEKQLNIHIAGNDLSDALSTIKSALNSVLGSGKASTEATLAEGTKLCHKK